MEHNYDHKKIEERWQAIWEEKKLNETDEKSNKPKYYSLVEFPYPSGDGLHVGHVRSYTAMDIISRKRRREGFEILFPIGYDAFGLPAENFAVKTGIHPKITTEKAISNFRKQLKSMGLSFDWSREIKTIDPKYYKWTQWIFLKLLENNLAYKAKIPINWCQDCRIGLANEEVTDGVCERCGGPVDKREKEQWMLAITKYAERLLSSLEELDYILPVKVQQKNWIGKSEGAEISFNLKFLDFKINVFTTRVDTLFGATYLVLSPEHKIISNLGPNISNLNEVKEYIKKAASTTDIERVAEGREKTGVKLEGISAINPANGEEIPVYTADYVLSHYGSGAIMAVPAHDERDYQFAKKFNLPVKKVVEAKAILEIPRNAEDIASGAKKRLIIKTEVYAGEGKLINSGEFSEMESPEAREKMTEKFGRRKVTYKLRDWVFSRQRYWGEPIPVILCKKCGVVPVPESELPVLLPEISDFMPDEDGESPLLKAKDWVNVKCPKCSGAAQRETDVMPNWAGSSWYFLRYLDSRNDDALVSKEKEKKWMPVDWYNGGMEHTTLHLLYSRFWYKFLFDIGAVSSEEPYKKRTSHGFILGEDNEKMSKSRGNVINPDEIVKYFGADTLRLYEMFIGPFDQAVVWSTDGLLGPRRFLDKLYKALDRVKVIKSRKESLMHQSVKKVSEDIESMKFNTAISAMMISLNELLKDEEISKEDYGLLLKLLAPFAPHITEELWQKLGGKGSIHLTPWPTYDKKKIVKKTNLIVVQVNGKVRGQFQSENSDEEEIKKTALNLDKVKPYLEDGKARRVIYVKDKLVNIVL
ncbi:leucine--tRNA ligase [Candidatus Campbellbacteria bacterium CG11_big_fil_rev_8_21_14_0_20_44_21]|uniref:Leucine--tRNA ligase n=1 Tax=Candidatus Campbellbacteria bacterium CG22_combo_CG10-13_8_21_14_all_43_18 TaxID=1974530 RepID=A0A2H0DWP5_9BACT|nr:MAG: leucine--tRNA ligase [Candidatus Campbellbacteria bacterium CG22_combo_CG10-13_8_21_14_all_43_18]PIR24515.1 MAG: leucine--tRNA ligase [Candidatus Campbellbacteria bacterium CG11_big_fil_rev_8_21_14_0_20_44_21]